MVQTNYNYDGTWTSLHLKSMATHLFNQHHIQANTKENIKAPHYLALCEGNSPLTGGFPSQRASNAERVSISWYHNAGEPTEAVCCWLACVDPNPVAMYVWNVMLRRCRLQNHFPLDGNLDLLVQPIQLHCFRPRKVVHCTSSVWQNKRRNVVHGNLNLNMPRYFAGSSWSFWIRATNLQNTWWRHQMGTSSALLALCAGHSPVTGEFPPQRPVMRSFDVFFYLRLNKRLSKQYWSWWFQTPSRSLWRHCDEHW